VQESQAGTLNLPITPFSENKHLIDRTYAAAATISRPFLLHSQLAETINVSLGESVKGLVLGSAV
jgi:hypothetical protein